MRRTSLLLIVLILPLSTEAVTIPVIDIDAIRQMLTSYRTQLEELVQAKAQLEQQVQAVKNLVIQVHQGSVNLQQLKVSNLQDMMNLLGQLESQLSEAKYVSYRVDQARQQAESLYAKASGQPNAAQQRALARQWTAAQRDSAALAVNSQAIVEQQAAIRGQWQAVQQRAQAAQGNLEIQQAQAQGQALLGVQLQAIQEQLATAARGQSQQQMEHATRTEMQLNAEELATQPYDVGTFTSRGRMIGLKTGTENQ